MDISFDLDSMMKSFGGRKKMNGKLVTALVVGLMFATVMAVSADEDEVVSGPILTQERFGDVRPTSRGLDDIETSPIQTVESVGDGKAVSMGGDVEEDEDFRFQVSTDPEAPYIPLISGPKKTKLGETQKFTVTVVDPEGDDFYCEVGFSDVPAIWRTYVMESGSSFEITHKWSDYYQKEGPFTVYVKAIDSNGHESDWAEHNLELEKSKQDNDYVSWLQVIFARLVKQFPLLEKILD
jgi:hypothetical protein